MDLLKDFSSYMISAVVFTIVMNWKHILAYFQVKKKCKESIKRFEFDLGVGLFKQVKVKDNEIYFFKLDMVGKNGLNKELALFVKVLTKLGYTMSKECWFHGWKLTFNNLAHIKRDCIGINKTTKTFWIYELMTDKITYSDVYSIVNADEDFMIYNNKNENELPEYFRMKKKGGN